MDFRTELSFTPSGWKVQLGDPVLTIGSCFSDVIGLKLSQFKFQSLVNPFGTTYHPFAIHKLLRYAALKELPSEQTYLEQSQAHFNYDFHSSLNGSSKGELETKVREKIELVHSFLKNCSVLVLTYGTAWVYELVQTGEMVANCHKVNASHFKKKLSTPAEIRDSFSSTLSVLRQVNPRLRVIISVSPVRHLKDTLPLNSVSKSTLRLACHEMESNTEVIYFPAFEVMMDDLRDYRFYKDDLIHPTGAAEEYIWNIFSKSFFSESALTFMTEWTEIIKALGHKPFHPNSPMHQKFLKDTLSRLNKLKQVVNVDGEIGEVEGLMKK